MITSRRCLGSVNPSLRSVSTNVRKTFSQVLRNSLTVSVDAHLVTNPFTYIQSNMPSNDFALAHPEWMMRGDISRLHAEHRHHMPWVKFDFTHPGFQAYTLAMWQRMAKDGLLGIKFDYPESAWIPTGGFHDPAHTTTTAYRSSSRGRDTLE